ncbi:MAG: sensor histidine kinase [Spirochaetaceae bacterium]|nr:MAG: sensor histidine kinase [Spirochaetaceae bacterium]
MTASALSLLIAYFETGRRGYILAWFAYAVFFTIAIAMNAIPGISGRPLLVAIAYGLFFLAYSSLDVGVLRFVFSLTAGRRRGFLITNVVALAALLLLSVDLSLFPARISVFNAWSALVFARVAIRLVRHRRAGRDATGLFAIAAASLVSAAWGARGVIAIIVATDSIGTADAATVPATLAVAGTSVLFLMSLFNLAQLRVSQQLESTRAGLAEAAVSKGAARFVAGVSHWLSTPVGTALLAISALPERDGADERIVAARTGLEVAAQRLRTLKQVYLSRDDSPASTMPIPELIDRLVDTASSIGIPVESAHRDPAGDSRRTTILANQFVRLVIDLIELSRLSGWTVGSNPQRIVENTSSTPSIDILGVDIPPDVWADCSNPLQRSEVARFAETLVLGALCTGLRDQAGVRSVTRLSVPPHGLRIEFHEETA